MVNSRSLPNLTCQQVFLIGDFNIPEYFLDVFDYGMNKGNVQVVFLLEDNLRTYSNGVHREIWYFHIFSTFHNHYTKPLLGGG